MKNIELKIILSDPKTVIYKLKEVKAIFSGKLIQTDTYYHISGGRLKLRETIGKIAQLVYYERPDTKKSKISDFQILPIKISQLKNIKNILSQALGEKVIVKKERNLWLYRNTRIHIDKVKNLGNYLELETVVKKRNSKREKRASRNHKFAWNKQGQENRSLLQRFIIKIIQCCSQSYSLKPKKTRRKAKLASTPSF